MQKAIKLIWIFIIAVNLSGVVWFILGSTANFQRGIDLITTIVFITFAIPSLLLIFISIILLINKWIPTKWWEIIIVVLMMIGMLLLTPGLYKNVDTRGWLTERVRTDTLQQTSDKQFEYCIELINLFQKNSTARLYLKNTKTLEEMRIPLDIPIKEIKGITWNNINYFVKLEPTTDPNIYILHTTTEFPFPNERFEINIKERTAIKLN